MVRKGQENLLYSLSMPVLLVCLIGMSFQPVLSATGLVMAVTWQKILTLLRMLYLYSANMQHDRKEHKEWTVHPNAIYEEAFHSLYLIIIFIAVIVSPAVTYMARTKWIVLKSMEKEASIVPQFRATGENHMVGRNL